MRHHVEGGGQVPGLICQQTPPSPVSRLNNTLHEIDQLHLLCLLGSEELKRPSSPDEEARNIITEGAAK